MMVRCLMLISAICFAITLLGAEPRDAVSDQARIAEPYVSPIHYRPQVGILADTIPFYWKGEYHIFYLRANIGKVPWEHIVSTDLVHWKELPTALLPDGDVNGPDGEHMFTGCVIEKDGTFHIFYTGFNPRNPQGRELVMHATSPDLIQWTKHPDDVLAPDGIHYANPQQRDFRDPYVFWNDEAQEYWMVLCANSLKGGGPGLAVSKDLKAWQQVSALKAPHQECPDLFKIGDTWYLIGGDAYSFSKDLRSDFQKPPVQNVIDRPGVYAGKRMFDGKRHIWTGWVWDGNGQDGAGMTWGGTQCLPRELYAGPDGQLYQKPVDEVTAVFTETASQFDSPRDLDSACVVATPDHYMLQCLVQLEPQAALTITMRQQPDGSGGYGFVIRPKNNEAGLDGPGFSYTRPCVVDTSKPVKFQAFVQGTIIECFINDQFAYTSRAYNFPRGSLGLKVEGGKAKVLELAVKTDEPGFQSLFDGHTLDGWKAPDMSYWSIEDGAITAKITEAHPCTVNQYLVWREPMDDFELKLKFRISGSPQTNSGFQFRSKLLPNNDMSGYQMDNNRDSGWLARLYEEHGRETLAFRGKKAVIDANGQSTLSDIPDAGGEPWFRLEDWHEYDLICQGSHLVLKVNGRLAAEVFDNDTNRQALSGLLGLQLHSGPPMAVQFKDIRLKRLGAADVSARPLIRKLGTVDVDKVETTPIVLGGKLYRCEWFRNADCFHFVDCQTGETTPQFAKGWQFASAFVDGETVYVTGSQAGEKVQVWASKDLQNWDTWTALDLPGFQIFNTSLCKAEGKYVLMFEISKPVEQTGVQFTARFATSGDLKHWSVTPPECVYAKDRYTAPHCLRYLDGYFYNFYLENVRPSCYEQYVVRSKDFIHWESSPLNPVLRPSDDDRTIMNPKLTPEQRERVATAQNLNNSDIDFCEFQGRLVINYSWGNQTGVEHLAEAVYEGTLAEFLRGWFPERIGP